MGRPDGHEQRAGQGPSEFALSTSRRAVPGDDSYPFDLDTSLIQEMRPVLASDIPVPPLHYRRGQASPTMVQIQFETDEDRRLVSIPHTQMLAASQPLTSAYGPPLPEAHVRLDDDQPPDRPPVGAVGRYILSWQAGDRQQTPRQPRGRVVKVGADDDCCMMCVCAHGQSVLAIDDAHGPVQAASQDIAESAGQAVLADAARVQRERFTAGRSQGKERLVGRGVDEPETAGGSGLCLCVWPRNERDRLLTHSV